MLSKWDLLFPAASGLNEEQIQFQQMATDFAMNEMRPHMDKWDQEVQFIAFNLWTQFNNIYY